MDSKAQVVMEQLETTIKDLTLQEDELDAVNPRLRPLRSFNKGVTSMVVPFVDRLSALIGRLQPGRMGHGSQDWDCAYHVASNHATQVLPLSFRS